MNLKHLLFICLFSTVGCVSFSQTDITFLIENLDSITNSQINWKAIEKKDLSAKEKRELIKILKDTTYYFEYCSEGNSGAYLPYFHFIDLDGDKDLDIVFNEKTCSGHEIKSIYVFMNKNGKYELVVREAGRVVNIDLKAKEMLFYEYPCCASVSNIYRNYKIEKDTVYPDYGIVFYSASFPHLRTTFPYQMKKSIELDLTTGTELYMYPQRESKYDIYFDKENLIGRSDKNVTVEIYSTFTDESGDTWKHCLIESKSVNFINEYMKNRHTHYTMVWIKD